MAKRVYLGISNSSKRVKTIYLGVSNVARKIKKAYIGINGISKQFFSSGELFKYGVITPLSNAKFDLAATTSGNYALFGGGESSYYGMFNTSEVDAYTNFLTKTSAPNFSTEKSRLGATFIGNYAIFAGGYRYQDTYSTLSSVEAYSQSLSKSVCQDLSVGRSMLRATFIGNYALFGEGYTSDESGDRYSRVVDAYSSSLTRSSTINTGPHMTNYAATTVGNYALFGGGGSPYDIGRDVVTAITSSLTKTSTSLPQQTYGLSATTIENKALFAGGYASDSWLLDYVQIVDSSLTSSLHSTGLSTPTAYSAAITLGDYALIGGGYWMVTNMGNQRLGAVDVFDKSLVRTTMTPLTNTTDSLATATVGDYALFGGGCRNNGNMPYDTVDVYGI